MRSRSRPSCGHSAIITLGVFVGQAARHGFALEISAASGRVSLADRRLSACANSVLLVPGEKRVSPRLDAKNAARSRLDAFTAGRRASIPVEAEVSRNRAW